MMRFALKGATAGRELGLMKSCFHESWVNASQGRIQARADAARCFGHGRKRMPQGRGWRRPEANAVLRRLARHLSGKGKAPRPAIAPKRGVGEKEHAVRILQTLATHLWPSKEMQPDHAKIKARVGLSLGMLVGSKLITIQVPFIFKDLVDSLGGIDPTSDPRVAVPVSLVLGYGLARSTAAGLQELRNAVFATVAQSAIRKVARDVFLHLHNLDLSFHLSKSTGEVTRIIDRGGRSIQYVLSSMVFNVVPTLLEITLVSSILASRASWEYSAVCFTTIGLYCSYTIGITQWRTQFRRSMIRLENEAARSINDSLVNYETVKYFHNEQHEADRYDKSLKGFQKASLKTQTSLSLLNFGQNAIFSCGLVGIMLLAARDITAGAATVGDLVLVNGLLFQLAIPLNFVGSTYREVRQALIDMSEMFKLNDQPPKVQNHLGSLPLECKGGTIRFEDVRFGYTNERDILNGLTFEVPAGKTVAIVGHSGCGKSTIIRLLYRFYDVDEGRGRITIDGQDLRKVTLDSLRSHVGVVPQETVLFNDSIGYNVQYGNFARPWEDVEAAVKNAQLISAVDRMPQGYDTVVGERGLMISGGEKQRVAIARAMLKDSPILLCDEPTSSLDTRTEIDIMANLKQLGQNRTTIVIAHRLSTIQDADEILVLEEGRVSERGKHHELLSRPSMYRDMWQAQQATAMTDMEDPRSED